jgi:hypothetical protein
MTEKVEWIRSSHLMVARKQTQTQTHTHTHTEEPRTRYKDMHPRPTMNYFF